MSTRTARHDCQRPWYCPDSLVEDYLEFANDGGDLQMLKRVRAIESLIVNIGIIAITLAALHFGEANSYVVSTAIVTLGLLNGLIAADYRALAQAIVEFSQAYGGDDDDGP